MAKSSEEQAFEEILDYQEPVRPDPKEFYISSQGREVSLDFFLYSCLEEEKTCDALPEKFAKKLTEKRWPLLTPYVQEEIFDANDERVSIKEIAEATPEELIKTLCQWYRDHYPQLAWDTPLDYIVHSEVIEEFVLMTKDIKALFKAKQVRSDDKIRPEQEKLVTSEELPETESEPESEKDSTGVRFDEGNHSVEGEPDPLTASDEAENPDVAESNAAQNPDSNGSPDLSEPSVIENENTPETVESAVDSSEKVSESGSQVASELAEEPVKALEVKDAKTSNELSKAEAPAAEAIPTYGDILADCIRETFPAYSHLMVEYLSWSSRKAGRAKPDLANIPPVGRFLGLLKKRSGAPRDRDFKDRDRSSSRDGGRSSSYSDRGDRPSAGRDRTQSRDRDRSTSPRPVRDRGDRSGSSRRESAHSDSGHDSIRKDREERAIQDLEKKLNIMRKNPDQVELQLAPENSFIRRIQHKHIKEQSGFTSVSTGEGSDRAVMIQKK